MDRENGGEGSRFVVTCHNLRRNGDNPIGFQETPFSVKPTWVTENRSNDVDWPQLDGTSGQEAFCAVRQTDWKRREEKMSRSFFGNMPVTDSTLSLARLARTDRCSLPDRFIQVF